MIDAAPAPDCWVFDLDGTLTLPSHDFDAIRAELGIPRGQLILEYIAGRPASEARDLRNRLDRIEAELAAAAVGQPDARACIEALRDAGHRIGILTRNSRANARITLERLDVADLIDPDAVLGRDEAAPKPDPDGILRLLERWRAPNARGAMVGDHRMDLEAGRRAGVHTVHFDPAARFPWPELADRRIRSLAELCPAAHTGPGG